MIDIVRVQDLGLIGQSAPASLCGRANGPVGRLVRSVLKDWFAVRVAGRTPERLRIELRGIDEELEMAEDGTSIEQQIQVMPGDLPPAARSTT